MPVTIGGSGPITGVTSINTSVSDTELGYLDGVTSALQTQINTKAASASPTFTGNVVWSGGTLRADTAEVTTSQNTTSTSYGDLGTVGPAVTVTTGTKALVIVSCQTYNTTVGDCFISFAVSGATTVAAADKYAVNLQGSNNAVVIGTSRAYLLTGLTAGSNTFTLKYRVSSGTGYFANRQITVIDMGS